MLSLTTIILSDNARTLKKNIALLIISFSYNIFFQKIYNTEAENTLLAEIADQMAGFPTIPCTTCAYCMPCPYGVDIPGNFAYYNEAVNSHILPLPDKSSADYAAKKEQFAEGLRKALPNVETWARSCADCEECLVKCPQQIRIPNQMTRIAELLRKR